MMEWKLVAYIGSMKEAGITQPDLVKATGQDKRSVPRRTDFLSHKGYIVKRTHMTRGMKTSKLWLTKFAPPLPSRADALKGIDTSIAVLTRDMEPVPWVHQWVGSKDAKGKEELAYHALVQTIVAVIKAWGTLRMRDLKVKLGVIGLKWQMNIVSKFLRRAYERGTLGYTAAQFAGSNVIFKDCVRFIREPTEDDWRILLATGVKTSPWRKLTSQKERKKMMKAAKKRGRPKANAAPLKVRTLQKRLRLPTSPTTAQWKPEKPIANTVAEYVLTGAKEGYTTTEVSTALVGPEFHRYLFKHMSNMCQDVQPAGLQEYQMTSEKTKSGDVQSYAFVCAGVSDPAGAPSADSVIDPALAQQSIDQEVDLDDFGFAPLEPSDFVNDESVDMASLVKLVPFKTGRWKRRKLAADGTTAAKPGRKRKASQMETGDADGSEAGPAPEATPDAVPDAAAEAAPGSAPGSAPRVAPEAALEPAPAPTKRKRRKAAKKVRYVDDLDIGIPVSGSDEEPVPVLTAIDKPAEQPEEAEESSTESAKSVAVESVESEGPQERTAPGVYVGIPGSLNPNPHKKGRPRKSLVLIFKSDKLMNPNFLPGWLDYPHPRERSPTPPRKSFPPRKRRAPPSPSKSNSPDVVPELHEQGVVATGPDQPGDVSQMLQQTVEQVDPSPGLAQTSEAKSASQFAAAGPRLAVVESEPNPATGSLSIPVETPAADKGKESPEAKVATADSKKRKREKPKITQAIEPNEKGKYVCVQCGGTWENDNGLKYHLTKGKNPCNAYYAANPQLMQRERPGRKGRYSSSEENMSVHSGSQVSSDVIAPSIISEGSLASEVSISPERGPRPREKKRKTVVKKKERSEMVLEPVEPMGPAMPRPVLKPRSMPKDGRLGGNGIVPRGVEASEAAAKRIAAEEAVEASHSPAADAMMIDGQDSAVPAQEFWKPNEELPYLKHVSAKTARQAQRNGSEASSNQEYQSFEVQYAGGAAFDDAELAPLPHSPTYEPGVSDYPAELLDPALGSVGVEKVTSPALPANIASLARKPLPDARIAKLPANAAIATATATGQVPRQGGGSFQRLLPSVRIPDPAYDSKEGEPPLSVANERRLLPFRIQEIIVYLVTANGGAYPKERKTLHWSVLKVFKETYGFKAVLPTQTGTVRGLNSLEKEKVVKTASVAIQPHGSWLQYEVVYLPEIDVKESPVVNYLKSRAEAVHPEMYFPPPFVPDASERVTFSSVDRPIKGRETKVQGRRDQKLPPTIATLNAPFYLKEGIGGVRIRYAKASDTEDDDGQAEGRTEERNEGGTGRRKKRRRVDGLVIKRKRQGNDDERPARTRGRAKRVKGDEYVVLEPSKLSIGIGGSVNPGLSSLPVSFFVRTTADNISFLAPNTQLEDDYIPSEPSEHSVQFDDGTEDIDEPMVPPGTMAEMLEIHASSRGVWPPLSFQFFEDNPGSFTIEGWMPTQTERLMDNLPQTSEEMGLQLMSHYKTDKWADPAYGTFLMRIEGCKAWELSDKGTHFMSGSIAPNYLYMNFGSTPAISSTTPVKLEWLDENEWSINTIPYDQLEDNDDQLWFPRGPGRPKGSGKPKQPGVKKVAEKVAKKVTKKKPGPKPKSEKKKNQPQLAEFKMQREIVMWPRYYPDEYFRIRGDTALGIDWKAEDTRIAAYVAVTTLTGGINKAMQWGLMLRIFPEAKLSNLRKFWSVIQKERGGFIHNLSEKFQEGFLGAYERGEMGHFDFEDPLKFDWLRLVKWTLALVVREGIELPLKRRKFDAKIDLLLVENAAFDWRETYHNWQRSVFNKFQDSTSEAASMLIDASHDVVDNDVLTARSWVRALCNTHPTEYDPVSIRDKFKTLAVEGKRTEAEVSDLLEATIKDLEDRRLSIRSKSSPLAFGRPYQLNHHFVNQLKRYANEIKFSVAADFKSQLDAAFQKDEPVELSWRTEDGMIVAAFNLQAAGRVRIEPTPETRLQIPFGFRPGFYESRKFPKSHYRFDLQVVPTDRYLYNEDIAILHTATQEDNIPAATADGKLPMWCDFHGHPDRRRWFRMLAAVLFAYATRGAMKDDFMMQALKPCFEQFEIKMIREWGLKNGLLTELTGPGSACTVTEWWWLVLGQPMLEMQGEEASSPGPARQTSAEGGDEAEPVLPVSGRRTKDQYEEQEWARARRGTKFRLPL